MAPERACPGQSRMKAVLIVPALNEAAVVGDLVRRTPRDIIAEVIVVDNGSTDGSAEVLDDFPNVQPIRLPKNFGLTKALNVGVRAADGEYILLLHDDARIPAEAVARLADFLESRPEVGAVCPLRCRIA